MTLVSSSMGLFCRLEFSCFIGCGGSGFPLAQQLSHRGCKKSSFTGLRFVCLQKESRLKYAWERKHFPSKDYIGSYRSEVSSSQNKWLTPIHWQREKSQSTEPCLDGWLADPVGVISSAILVDLATKQKKVSPCYFVVGALLSSQIKTSVHILSSLNYIHHFIRGPKTWVAGWHCHPESFCASGKFLRITPEIAMGSFRTLWKISR